MVPFLSLYRSFRGSNQINPLRESVHYISLHSRNCSSLLHSFPLPESRVQRNCFSPSPKRCISLAPCGSLLWTTSKSDSFHYLCQTETPYMMGSSKSWGIERSSIPINLPMKSAAQMVDPSCCCRAHSRQMLTSQHWTSAHHCQHKSNLQATPIKTREKSPQFLHPNHQQVHFIVTCAQILGTKRTTNLFMSSHQIVHFCRAIPGHHPASPFREISGSPTMLSVACRCCIRSWPQAINYTAMTKRRSRRTKMITIIVWWWYASTVPCVCNLEQW